MQERFDFGEKSVGRGGAERAVGRFLQVLVFWLGTVDCAGFSVLVGREEQPLNLV